MCRAQCFCGNTAPSEDLKVEESQCQDVCSGDQSEICGGFWTINIYTINYDFTPLDVLVGPVEQHGAKLSTWKIHVSGDESGLGCSESSVSISSWQYPDYFIAKCRNDLVLASKPGEWTNFCNVTGGDLNQQGCWKIEPAENVYYIELFSSEGSRGDNWVESQLQYRPENENYELMFTGETGTNNPGSWGDIALDDIYVYYGDCVGQTVCTFENADMCGFSQDEASPDQWTVGSFFEDNSGSAPPSDHTSQGQLGRSVFYQNFPDNASLFSASFVSPQYEPFQQGCVSFWYYMWSDFQDQNVTLTVNVKDYEDPRIFRFGRMKDRWEKASFSVVTETKTQFVFKVEGKNEPGHVKTVAFDDYMVDRTDFCADYESLTCDFETKNFCNWQNLETDDRDWVMGGGAGGETDGLSPDSDHTTGTHLGHYLYVSQSQAARGQTAALESNIAVTLPYAPSCFSFWSFMYGNNNGRLTVVKVSTVTQQEEIIFDKVESLAREWKFHQIEIPTGETVSFYYLKMVVTSENNQQDGIIAIDDLLFEDQSCPSLPEDTFKCSDGEEISITKKCDFVLDCSNGLDELECGDCDFEAGLCGWSSPYLPSKFSW